MEKHVIHISEAEAASDFAAVLARVRAGAEIVIEGREPIVVVRAGEVRAAPVRGRLLSESIALAKAHAEELRYEPTLDPDFAADLEEIVKSRKPREISSWEQSSIPACSSQENAAGKVCRPSCSECRRRRENRMPRFRW
jgi:hypothetical protein